MNFKDILIKIPLFNGLNEEAYEQLSAILRRNVYKKDGIILREDEKSGNIYIISRGEVKTAAASSDGREHVLSIHKKNDFFNEGALIGDKGHPINAVAIRETELLSFNRVDFISFLTRNPIVYEKLIEQLIYRLQKAARQESSLALFDVSGRVARFLMDLAMEEGEKTERGEIVITRPTQHEIAIRIGTTRESVSRALRDMESNGLIKIIGKRIVILKQDANI